MDYNPRFFLFFTLILPIYSNITIYLLYPYIVMTRDTM